MGREYITGLVFRRGALHWTTLQGLQEVAASGRLDPAAEGTAPEAAGEGPVTGPSVDRIREQAQQWRGRLTLGLNAEDVLLRVLDVPTVDANELPPMVELQVDKLSPFPIENMVVGHEVLRRGESSTVVLAAAVRDTVVQRLGDALHSAGLYPQRVDVAAMAWWQLLLDAERIESGGRHAVFRFEAGAPEFLVYQDHVPIVFHSMGGMEDLQGASLVGEMAREVTYALMSLEMEHGAQPLLSASAWCAGDWPGGLTAALAEACGCEVRTFPLADMPPLSQGLARRFALRAGLNLMPGPWVAQRAARRFRKRMVAAVAAVVGVWFLGMGGLFGALYVEEHRLGILEASLAAWEQPALEVREMRRRVSTIRRYKDDSRSVLECLREISALQPPGIELTSFTYRKGESTRLVGEADSRALILTFAQALGTSTLFDRVNLGAQTADRQADKVRFEMDLILPGGFE